ncbi:tetratricopeptide repeat protein [Kitasatospora sp. NPDC089797]|uniref:tetratricopeptide repeat protein n=1 Tax=Kitasatospora sp. NPDC089797 TaxID=3155298 RepID=UPI0034324822
MTRMTGTSRQLPDEVHAEITELCQEGDALAELGDLTEAKQRYVEALRLLPGDPRGWAASTWIYVAIGDVHFRLGVHDRASRCFQNAVQCPGGLGNPYVHLRLGQTAFELGDHDRAADELIRAHMGGGPELFDEDDPRYLAFLRTRADLDGAAHAG